MTIGIIGLGNIGGMLLKRFSEFLDLSNIIVFSHHKINNKEYLYTKSAQELIEKSNIVFLCIRPQNLKEFFNEIKLSDKILRDKIFVTTVAAINENTYYKNLGKIKLIRIIPSMINKIGGPILLSRGKYASPLIKNKIRKLLLKVGDVYEVKEKEIDMYTHISSCSPAFIVEFLRLYVFSLVKKEKDKEMAINLISDVLEITAQLFRKDRFKVISQVCTKGGITEQGIKIIDSYKDTLFKNLANSLLKRMNEVRKKYGK